MTFLGFFLTQTSEDYLQEMSHNETHGHQIKLQAIAYISG